MTTAFDTFNTPGGYAWWYLDALSDDGQCGLTLIAFIGSVFSPYYAWARKRGRGLADPFNHCALNVALYARPGSAAPTAWTMTERARGAVQRSASSLVIGPSSMSWQGDTLHIRINERTVPWARQVKGEVRLYPSSGRLSESYALDAAGHHQWCPIAPCARVEVELDQPDLSWGGRGYLDSNWGTRPLADDFSHWDWSRAALKGRTAVLYDTTHRDGSTLSLAMEFDERGQAKKFYAPPPVDLAATSWRLARSTRSDRPLDAMVTQTLEDSPFYARSLLHTHLLGEDAVAVHESLSLTRWAQPVVQAMLPFRMPRRG
jgi:carotenoid 1,2-hydratase